MSGLEEIQEIIKNFICDKEQTKQQISVIEEQRTQLAQQRNEKKKIDDNNAEIDELGRQITELGNESQELQSQLDSKFHAVKSQINSSLDNLITEGIRKIRKINDQIQELKESNAKQKERNAKFHIQRKEFFARFGRMPELSENAIRESRLQEKQTIKNIAQIKRFEKEISKTEKDISQLLEKKKEIQNGNWNLLLEAEQIYIEPLYVEEMEPIEELKVEQFDAIEELYVEEFQPIEEIYIEEFKENTTPDVEVITENREKIPADEIEEIARAIVEEIVAEQTKSLNINNIENTEEKEAEDIIAFKQEKKEKVIIPLFGQKATISTIVVKFEDGELIYKAQISDGEEIKIYPSKLGEESVLLRDKQNREECREILINYSVSEYKELDKKVVNKIDPLVCELLIECADEYGYNAQELIYNYAMSFSNNQNNGENFEIGIIYNLSYIEQSNLNQKERAILKRICKNARNNDNVDIIESFSGFKKIKYIFKRLFAVNNINVLPEAKY